MSLSIQKKKTLILITVVVIIWGGLSFQLTQSIGKKETSNQLNKNRSGEINQINKREKYSVLTYSTDPFLGKPIVKSKKKSTKPIKKKPINHPKITYLGKLQANQRALHLFSVDGRIVQWGIGEEKLGYILTKKHNNLVIRHTLTKEIAPIIQSKL